MSAASSTAVVFLLALAVRLAAISEMPVETDEFYHLLAAHSWTEDGAFRILDGEYLRAQGFTVLVGLAFKIFGVSVVAGRLPSVIFGSTLVAALFVWTRDHGGRGAAWVSALMLCFASIAVDLSAFVRFYAPHALLFWLAAVIIYDLTGGLHRTLSFWMLLPAGIFFAGAWHLQVTTTIGIFTMIVWASIDAAYRVGIRRLFAQQRVRLCLGALFFVGLLSVPLGLSVKVEELYSEFRHVELWNAQHQNEITYYYSKMHMLMPLLWNLFPAAAVVAFAARPRPALFCTVLTAVPIIVHSFGGMKETRYVFYVLPFFFTVWGIAISVFVPLFNRWTHEAFDRLFEGKRPASIVGGRVRQLGSIFVGIVLAAAAVIGNPVFKETAGILTRSGSKFATQPSKLLAHPPDGPWDSAELQALVASASVVITSDDVRTAFHAGDFDLSINRANLGTVSAEYSSEREFANDWRTGRPVISSVDSLKRVMQCYPDGVVLISAWRWRKPVYLTDEVADFLEVSAVRTQFPAQLPSQSLLVFQWRNEGAINKSDCNEILTRAIK